MTEDQRIEQFKRMAGEDPENELGHFSLGRAFIEAGRFEEAIAPLSRAVELNPQMSKAYQLLGATYDRVGRRDTAIEVMTRGVTIAASEGSVALRDEMSGVLEDWGAPVPTFEKTPHPAPGSATDAADAADDSGFECSRCHRQGGQLPKAPFKGSLGEKVLAHTCAGCWQEWIAMGTKVINELGLVLSAQAGQDTYDQYMREFLELERV